MVKTQVETFMDATHRHIVAGSNFLNPAVEAELRPLMQAANDEVRRAEAEGDLHVLRVVHIARQQIARGSYQMPPVPRGNSF